MELSSFRVNSRVIKSKFSSLSTSRGSRDAKVAGIADKKSGIRGGREKTRALTETLVSINNELFIKKT